MNTLVKAIELVSELSDSYFVEKLWNGTDQVSANIGELAVNIMCSSDIYEVTINDVSHNVKTPEVLKNILEYAKSESLLREIISNLAEEKIDSYLIGHYSKGHSEVCLSCGTNKYNLDVTARPNGIYTLQYMDVRNNISWRKEFSDRDELIKKIVETRKVKTARVNVLG